MSENKKLQLEVAVDASQARAGFEGVKAGAQEMAGAVADAGKKAAAGVSEVGNSGDGAAKKIGLMEASIKRSMASTQRSIALMQAELSGVGGAKSAMFENLAGLRGVDSSPLQPLLAQMRELEAQEAKLRASFSNGLGPSAKQTAAALRMVPAQMTDIIVSLQAGQQPMTVLLQQGGQLKDMFGGVGGAAKALGGYVLGLLTPLNLVLASTAGVVAGFVAGGRESEGLRQTLALSGAAAGMTSDRLMDMSSSLSAVAGATRGDAISALTDLATSGNIAEKGMNKAAEAMLRIGRAGSASEAKSLKEAFDDLGKSPVEAAEKLNEKYRFLTGTLFEQIRALEERGEKDKAAALAQDALADKMIGRSKEAEKQLGYLSRSWNAVAKGAKEAWDAMLGLGRDETTADKIASLKAKIATAGGVGEDGKFYAADTTLMQKQLSALEAQFQGETKVAAEKKKNEEIEYRKQKWSADGIKYLSEEKRLRVEINKIRKEGELAGVSGAEIEARVASAREKHKPKAAPHDDLARLKLEARGQEAGLAPDTVAEIDKLNAALEKRNITTAEYNRLLGVALDSDRVLSAEEKERVRTLEETTKAQTVMAQTVHGVQKAYAQMADKAREALMSPEERELAEALRQVADRAQQAREALSQKAAALQDNAVAQAEYRKQLAAVDAMEAQAVIDEKSRAETRRVQNADWTVGMNRALTNYKSQAENIAGSTEQAFTRAFSGMEDALVNFTMTGKLNFSDFARSVIADILKIQMRESMSKSMSAAGGWLSGIFGSSGSAAAGSAAGDSIAAAMPMMMANGGVFTSPSLSAYSNQIHDKPQIFAFAKGAGVFGEAGPEAIMPLGRDAQGRLGVRTAGASDQSSGGVNIVINVTNGGGDQKTSQGDDQGTWGKMAERIKGVVREEIVSQKRPGGALYA